MSDKNRPSQFVEQQLSLHDDPQVRKLAGSCQLTNSATLSDGTIKSQSEGGETFDATTAFAIVNCNPGSQLVHKLIGDAENGKPTANIFSNVGTFTKVGAQWSSSECWGGNW